MKVLFVDDEFEFLEQTKIFLEKEYNSLDIVTADSAQEGLELLDDDGFDAVVSDYQMPGMDGLDFLEIVRNERNSEIPFIIFTGKGREEVAREALNLGADRYLQKGGDPKSQYGLLADAISQEVEHHRAETELKEREEKFRKFFENMSDMGFVLNEEGVVVEVNEAYCKNHGYDREKLLGKSLKDLPKILSEEDRKVTIERFKKMKKGEEVPPVKVTYRTKSGETRYADMRSVPIKIGENFQIIGIARDITERREAEKREEFLHSLLRHDVLNKAQIVEGYLELAEDFDVPDDLREYFQKAKKTVKNAEEIIEKVRTLRNLPDQEETQKVNLHSLIENVTQKLRKLFSESNIKIECSKEDVIVQGGPLLEELFSNLLENTVKHADCSEVKVDTEEKEQKIKVIVEDDGKGINEEDKEKIFEKGYKTAESGGSGLGLYLVKEIAETYGGSVEVKDSNLGGARFEVQLKKK